MFLAILAAMLSTVSSPPAVCEQPLIVSPRGADPWLVSDGNQLYYTQTTGSGIQIWASKSIDGVTSGAPATVFQPPRGLPFSKNIWAPELHKLDGAWYLFFAADDGRNENHRMYVLESKAGPLGPFSMKGRISAPGEDNWAIDGTVFEYNGNRYFIWSGWPGKSDGLQNIYISRMKSPWELETMRALISTPEHIWESWINEGPEIYRKNGRIFLVFSANRSWTDHYRIGVLELVSDDPLNKKSWRKWKNPLMESSEGQVPVYGPGHCSFFTESDGTEWILYHSARYSGAGWDREVRAEKWPARFFLRQGLMRSPLNMAAAHHQQGRRSPRAERLRTDCPAVQGAASHSSREE